MSLFDPDENHWWNHPLFLWSCVAALIVAGLAVVVLGFVWLVNGTSRHANDVNCGKFATASGYETKFDPQGFWSQGVCYVHAEDGRWVPRDLFYFDGSRPGR